MPDILNLATRPEIEPIDNRIDIALNQVMGEGAPKIDTSLLGGITIDANPPGQGSYIQEGFNIDKLKPISGYEEFKSSFAKEFDPEGTDMQNIRPYATRQPLSEWWANAALKTMPIIGNSFMEGWYQNGRNIEALVAWDKNKLYSQNNTLDQMEEDRYKYPTFGKGIMDDSNWKYAPWNLRQSDFYGEMLPQLGFTIGTMGQAILENMAIAWATGGIGVAANSLRNTSKLATLGKGFVDLFEAANGIKNLKRGLTALSSLQKEGRTLSGILGAGGKMLANGYAMYNTAAAEGSFEASHVLAETEKHLIDKFVQEKGYQPFGDDLDKIRDTASKAAVATFGWNLPVLLTSNLIQFNNIIKPFKPISSIANRLDDVALKATKEGIEAIAPNKWMQRAKGFGRFFLEGVSEGLEESSQALISNTASKYYEYLAEAIDPRTSFNTALSEAFDYVKSKEGFDEFMGGFLGGTLFKGVGYVTDKIPTINKLLNRSSKKDKESLKQMGLDILNEVGAKDILKYVQNPDVENYIKQLGLEKEMQAAALMNNRTAFNDAKLESVRNFIYAGLQTGKLDVKLSTLELMKELTDEEIAKEFDISLENKDEIAKQKLAINEYVDSITRTARNIEEDFKSVEKRYGNRFDPITQYDNFQAWEQAKKVRVFTRNIAESSKQEAEKLINKVVSKTLGRINSNMFAIIVDENLRNQYRQISGDSLLEQYIEKTLKPYAEIPIEDQTPVIKNKIKELEIFTEIDKMLKEGQVDLNKIAQSLYNLNTNQPNDLTDFVDSQETHFLIKDIEEALIYESKNRDAITAYNYLNGKGFQDIYEKNLKAQKELSKKPEEIINEEKTKEDIKAEAEAEAEVGVEAETETPTSNLGEEVDYKDLTPEEFVQQINSQLPEDFIPRISLGFKDNTFIIDDYEDDNGKKIVKTAPVDRATILDYLKIYYQNEDNFRKPKKKEDINNDNLNKPVEEVDKILREIKDVEGKNKQIELYPISTTSLEWEERNDESFKEERDWMTRTQYFYDNILNKKLKREINKIVALPVTDMNISKVEEQLGLKNGDLAFMLNPDFLFSSNKLSGHINYIYVNKTKDSKYELLDQEGNVVTENLKDNIVRSRHVDRKINPENKKQTDKLRGWSKMTNEEKELLVKDIENFGNKLSDFLSDKFMELPFAISQGIENIFYKYGNIEYSDDVKTEPTVLFDVDKINKDVNVIVNTSKTQDYKKDPETNTYLITGRPYLEIKQPKFSKDSTGSVSGKTFFYLDNFKLSTEQKAKIKESILQILESDDLSASDLTKYVSGVINAKIGDNKLDKIDSKYQISIFREKKKDENGELKPIGNIRVRFYDFEAKAQKSPTAQYILENPNILDSLLDQLYHKVDNDLLKKKQESFTDLTTGEEFPSYTHYLIGHKNAPLTVRLNPSVRNDSTELARIQKYSILDYSAIDSSKNPSYREERKLPLFIFRKQADAKPAPQAEENPIAQTKAEPIQNIPKGQQVERPKFQDFLITQNVKEEAYSENGNTIKEGLIWTYVNEIRHDNVFIQIRGEDFESSLWEMFIDLFVTKKNKRLQEAYNNNRWSKELNKFPNYLRNAFLPYVAGNINQSQNKQSQTKTQQTTPKNKYNEKSDIIGKTMSDGKTTFTVNNISKNNNGVNTTSGWLPWSQLNNFNIIASNDNEDNILPFEQPESFEQPPNLTPEEEQAAFEAGQGINITPEQTTPIVEVEKPNVSLSEEGAKLKQSIIEDISDEDLFKLESSETEPLTEEELSELKKMVNLRGLELIDSERMLGDRRVWGSYKDGVIKIYLGAKKGTGYHEAFELVYNGILNKNQQDKLYEDFKKQEGEFTTYLGETKLFSDATQKEAKEFMADEFIDFKQKDLARSEVRNIFIKIWNFIKDFIRKFVVSNKFLRENSTPTIERIYQDLAKGFYKDIEVKNTLQEYFSISDIPMSFTQDFVLTATNKLFNEFLQNDNGRNLLSELEEGTVSEEEFFNSFKDIMNKYFNNVDNQLKSNSILYGRYLAQKRAKELNITTKQLSAEDKANIKNKTDQSLSRGIGIYENLIKENYDDFKKVMKTILQTTMSLSFEEATNEEDEQERSQAEKSEGDDAKTYDYVKDNLKFDNFKSVSATVKLLIGSIMDATYINATNAVQPVISDVTMMEKTGTYYKSLFNKFMNYLVDITTPEAIKAKMENIIEQRNQDEGAISSVSFNIFKAQMKQFYDMIFKDSEITSDGQLKLRARFFNAFQKQKPNSYRLKSEVDGDTSTDNTFLQSDAFETIAKSKAQEIGKRLIRSELMEKPKYVFKPNLSFTRNNLINKTTLISALADVGVNFDIGFLNMLNNDEYSNLVSDYEGIIDTIQDFSKRKATVFTKNRNPSALPFWGRINNIAELYAKYHRDDTDIMKINPEGNAQNTIIDNNFISILLSEASNARSWDDFISEHPYLQFSYSNDSILLDKIKEYLKDNVENRNKENIPKIAILSGEESNNRGKTTDKMSVAELFKARFNFSFDVKGRKAAFPIYENADSSTDYYLQTGQYFSMTSSKNSYTDRFRKYLKAEIQSAIDFKSDIKNLNTDISIITVDGKKINRKAGISLGFSLSYLPYNELQKIYEQIDIVRNNPNGSMTADDIVNSVNKDSFSSFIENYLNSEVEKEYKLMKDIGYVRENKGVITTYMIDKSILNDNLTTVNPKVAAFKKLLHLRQVNNFTHVNELSKVLFGRVQNIKSIEDGLKRYKNFMSPRNTTLSDPIFNEAANKVLNKRVIKDKDNTININLKEGDIGYTNFREEFNVVFSEDFLFKNEMLSKLHAQEGKYLNIESSDGQSYAVIDLLREILWKSGGKFTKTQEHMFQVLKAYERVKLNNLGNKYSASEKNRDLEILAPYKQGDRYNLDDALAPLSIVKPIHSGIIENQNELSPILIKTSSMPLSLYLVEGTRMEDVYISMLKNDKQLLAFPSATKIGLPQGVSSIINSDGTTKDVSKLQGLTLRTKDFGIQTETQNTKTTTTAGTQTMKILTSNLYDGGKPKDFKGSIDDWHSLSEENKLKKSTYYTAEIKHRDALKAVFNKNYEQLLENIGIVYKNGVIESVAENQVTAYIKEQIMKHGVANNIVDQLDVDEDGNKVVFYEMMSDYGLIKSIIFSMVDKGIISPKVNGSMKIQASVAFFERKDIPEDFELLIKNKKGEFIKRKEGQKVSPNDQVLVTSSRLKFYSQDKDGKTLRMQVMISSDMLRKVNERRDKLKLPKLNKDELIEYLNKDGKELLRGVGFRIPTQGMNSIDSFEIVDFLPDYMGDAIVVPAELPEKAGSDFDVDKLSVYFNNYSFNKEGLPVYIKFDNSNELKNKRKRYIDYVREKYDGKIKGLGKYISEEYNYEDSYANQLEDQYTSFKLSKDELKELKEEDRKKEYEKGISIFNKLPVSVKKFYWNMEDKLEIKGKEKMSFYQAFTRSNIDYIVEKIDNGITTEEFSYTEFDKKTGKEVEKLQQVFLVDLLKILEELEQYYPTYFKNLEDNKTKYDELYNAMLSKFRENKDIIFSDKKEAIQEVIDELSDSVVVFYEKIAIENNIVEYTEFQELSIYEQNSRKAVENNYFEAMDEIMMLQENFKRITKPNNSARAEEVATRLANLKGIKEEPKERLFNFNKLTSPVEALINRIGFLEYKKLIGIAAVGVTSHANMQKGLYLSEVVPYFSSNTFTTKKEMSFKEEESLRTTFSTISNIKNVDDEDIMDTIGMFVDGTVDVVKKPWLISFGADKIRFGPTIMGIKYGMSLDDIGNIISSPFVEEYTRVKRITQNAVSQINPDFKELKGMTYDGWEEYINKKYGIFRKDDSVSINSKKVETLISKVFENGVFNPEKLKELNQSEIDISFAMLDTFLFLEKRGTNIRQIVSTSNHETTHLKDNTTGEVKESAARMLNKPDNELFKVYENGNLVNAVNYLRKSTFVEPIIYNLNQFQNEVIYKYILHPEMKKITDKVIKQLSNDDELETFAESVQKYNKAIEIAALSNFLFDSPIIGPSTNKSNRIVDNIDAYTKRDTDNPKSLYNFLQIAKVNADNMDDAQKILTGMSVFNYIEIVDEPIEGRYFLKIKNRPSGTEIIASNNLFDAFELLRSNTNKVPGQNYTYRDIYHIVMVNSILRNGIGFSKNSLLSYMNKEDYRELSKEIQNLSVDDNLFEKISRNAIQNEYNKLDNVLNLSNKNPYIGKYQHIDSGTKQINKEFIDGVNGVKLGFYITKKGNAVNNKISEKFPASSWKNSFVLMKDQAAFTDKKTGELIDFKTGVSKKSAFYRIEKVGNEFKTYLWIKQPYYLDIRGVRTSIYVPHAIKGTFQTREYQSSPFSEINENPKGWTKEAITAKLLDLGYIENANELFDERQNEEMQEPIAKIQTENPIETKPSTETTNELSNQSNIEDNTVQPEGLPTINKKCNQ